MRIETRYLAAWALGLATVAGHSFAQVTSPDSSAETIARPAQRRLPLAAGDVINLQVFDTPELSAKVRVSEDGYIDIPAAGRVLVAGLTPLEAGTAVEKHLRDARIMLNPHVSILVTEFASQGISVLGEVNKPGNYVLLGEHSLYDALALAGGVTQREGSSIVITHRSNPSAPVTIDVSSPDYSQAQRLTMVQPGDVIVVSRASSIYVVGDVAHPGEFPIQTGREINILKALALAQGLNRTAAASKASIVRKTNTGARTIPVDLTSITKNQQADPVLLPDDVLVVPRSGMKSFLEFTLPGATSAVAGSVAAALIIH